MSYDPKLPVSESPALVVKRENKTFTKRCLGNIEGKQINSIYSFIKFTKFPVEQNIRIPKSFIAKKRVTCLRSPSKTGKIFIFLNKGVQWDVRLSHGTTDSVESIKRGGVNSHPHSPTDCYG